MCCKGGTRRTPAIWVEVSEEGTNAAKRGAQKAVRTRAKMKENDGANERLGAIAEYQRGLFHAHKSRYT